MGKDIRGVERGNVLEANGATDKMLALHFQLDDHIPTIASYQASIISLGVNPAPPPPPPPPR